MGISVRTVTGAGMAPYFRPLAELRVAVFRAWPYLYEGTPDSDGDFNVYAAGSNAAFVVAEDAGTVVGVSTCTPLVNEPDNIRGAYADAGLDVARYFYFGESVLLPAYRGQGIGVQFFAGREAHARSVGGFTHSTFCGVRRAADDPRRPPDAVPLDMFWRKRGYHPLSGVACVMTWPEVGNPAPVRNLLDVWVKRLDPSA